MCAIIYWQNPCKLPMSFRCIKAYMLAFSGRFSRASLEGISFNFFVCFILNVSIGSAPKRKNFDIQRNTRVGSGCQFTSNLLSCHHIQSTIQGVIVSPQIRTLSQTPATSCSFKYNHILSLRSCYMIQSFR